jgi:hypothetical protein
MKRFLAISLLLASLLVSRAQESGSMQFALRLYGAYQVPPNDSSNFGWGVFTLEGDSLTYSVTVGFSFTPTGAGIYGPAAVGASGSLIFDWPTYIFVPFYPNPEPGTWFGYGYLGALTLTPEQIAELKAGLWYVSVKSQRFPDGELRGQICPLTPDSDCDFDGVANDDDVCPETQPREAVDAKGCSIRQLCPCGGPSKFPGPVPWPNHRAYVRCVREQAFRFWKEKRISVTERNAIIKAAEKSNCGAPLPPGVFPGPG